MAISTSARSDDVWDWIGSGAVPDHSHQLLGAPHRGGWRSRDVSPVALRLARAGRRGEPQGGAAWRHPGEGDDFPRLCSRGLDRRPFGLPLCDARERRRLRHRRRHGVLRPDRAGRGPRRFRARAGLDRRGDDRLRHDLHSQQRAPQRGPAQRFRPACDGRDHSLHPFHRHQVPQAQASAAGFDLCRSDRLQGWRAGRSDRAHAR